jgi:acyl-CoA reductase-like NAD-dependent aldehyde dehydrogenase
MSEGRPLHLDEQLASVISPVAFPSGTVLFSAGSKLARAFLVRSGQVRIEVTHPELVHPVLVRNCVAGDVIAPSALGPQAVHPCQAVASSSVEGFFLSRAALDKLGEVAPSTALALTSHLLAQASAELAATQVGHFEELLLAERDNEDEALLAAAHAAQLAFQTLSEAKVNQVIAAICRRVGDDAEALARSECAGGGAGNVQDKARSLRELCGRLGPELFEVRAVGKVAHDVERRVTEYATPVGVVLAVLPSASALPSSLTLVLHAIKARNAVVFCYPRPLLEAGSELIALVRDVLRAESVSLDLVQHLGRRTGRLRISRLLRNPSVDLILASGSPGLVEAARSSGNAAHCGAPANVPVFIAADANLDRSAAQIVASKSYDHGMVSGSESNLIVDRRVSEAFVAALRRNGALVLDVAQTERALRTFFDPESRRIRPNLVGQPAERFARAAEVPTSDPMRIVVLTGEQSQRDLLGREKLGPVLSLFIEDAENILSCCRGLLDLQGRGHSAVIHSEDEGLVERFAETMPVGRLLVNTGASFGVNGLSTGLAKSFVLGGGTFGKGVTTDNISWRHLVNVKRVAHQLGSFATAADE